MAESKSVGNRAYESIQSTAIVDDDGQLQSGWQSTPAEAREMAQQIQEAATNAVYDAAIVLWAKEAFPDDELMGPRMLQLIRDHRADAWGLPDQPEDWRHK